MSEMPAKSAPSPALPARRFRYWLHIRRSYYVGLVLVAFNVLGRGSGTPVWLLLLLIPALAVGVSATWTAYRRLMFEMPSGGSCISFVLVLGVLVYTQVWDEDWSRWLVIPTVIALLLGFVFDYRLATCRTERLKTMSLTRYRASDDAPEGMTHHHTPVAVYDVRDRDEHRRPRRD